MNRLMADFLNDQSGSDLTECFRHLSHVIHAQKIWLDRISENISSVAQWESLTAAEIKVKAEEHTKRFLKIVSDTDTSRIIHYTNSREDAYRNSVQEIIQHVIIHGQHHRAQISLLLRQMEIAPPPTDLIFFLRQP